MAIVAGAVAGASSASTRSDDRTTIVRSSPRPAGDACLLALPDGAMAYFPAATRRATEPPPVLVLLHGGGGYPREIIERFAAEARARDLLLLAPASKGSTWDAVRRVSRVRMHDGSGKLDGLYEFRKTADSERVEAAIAELAKHVPVDRKRTVLAGFSDGAGFALAVGLSRDHPFAAVMAFSPGAAIPAARPAPRRIALVSHGRGDRILSYEFTEEVILQGLARQQAEVIFRPFDGGHDIPDQVLTEFLDHSFGARRRPPSPRGPESAADCQKLAG